MTLLTSVIDGAVAVHSPAPTLYSIVVPAVTFAVAVVLSAADDVDTAGGRVRDRFDAAVHRVDDAVGRATDRLVPQDAQRSDADVRVEAS